MPTLVDVALAADRGDIYRVLLQTLEFIWLCATIPSPVTPSPAPALQVRRVACGPPEARAPCVLAILPLCGCAERAAAR